MYSHQSAEDYLETILILGQKAPMVRSVDVANALGYKKSSISVAMKKLKAEGRIEIGELGNITLTDSGRAIAESIYSRHTLFTNWLVNLGVDPKVAAEDACRLEHAISEESFLAIRSHIPPC